VGDRAAGDYLALVLAGVFAFLHPRLLPPSMEITVFGSPRRLRCSLC